MNATPYTTPIRLAIAQTLNRVKDVGRVHEYERYAADSKAFKNLYMFACSDKKDHIRGWYIKHAKGRVTNFSTTRYQLIDTWEVVGLMSQHDETQSDIVFDELVGDVCRSLRTDGSVTVFYEESGEDQEVGAQLTSSEHVMFAGVLCHRAVLELVTVRTVKKVELDAAHLDDFNTAGVKVPPTGTAIITLNEGV
ncbi:MAG: hypothetical protein AAF442_09340 [Pseudomonadota bacterium]